MEIFIGSVLFIIFSLLLLLGLYSSVCFFLGYRFYQLTEEDKRLLKNRCPHCLKNDLS